MAVKSGKGTVNDQIACSKVFINYLAMIDPTGLLSIAGTFMRPLEKGFGGLDLHMNLT